jgi:hypothetical protein
MDWILKDWVFEILNLVVARAAEDLQGVRQ